MRSGVNVAEPAVSTEWMTLTHEGKEIAESWSMLEGERVVLVFLVPRERLGHVTIEMLLIAAQISKDDVESWRLGDGSDGVLSELNQPLPLPSSDDTHLTVYVTLKSPVAVRSEESDVVVTPEKWQAIEAQWKTILVLEASIDASRLGMDGLRSEMESTLKKSLSVDEKLNALQNDVSQWSKAKSRIQFALPKVREFVHRATWSLAVPERKRLDEIVKNHIVPRIPFPEVDRLREQLEHLQKDRQVLFAQGNAVNQECRGI